MRSNGVSFDLRGHGLRLVGRERLRQEADLGRKMGGSHQPTGGSIGWGEDHRGGGELRLKAHGAP